MTDLTPRLAQMVPLVITYLMIFVLICAGGTIALLSWRAARETAEDRAT